jgi:hypothetical protein
MLTWETFSNFLSAFSFIHYAAIHTHQRVELASRPSQYINHIYSLHQNLNMGSKQHQYETMPLDDRDDRSSTEVESLMEVEKDWQNEDMQRPVRRSKTSRICNVLNQWRWLIDTTLLLLILGLVARSQFLAKPINPNQIMGDVTGVGPECESHCL